MEPTIAELNELIASQACELMRAEGLSKRVDVLNEALNESHRTISDLEKRLHTSGRSESKTHDLMQFVRLLFNAREKDHKIGMIKEVRDLTGCGLLEAKELVEQSYEYDKEYLRTGHSENRKLVYKYPIDR